jgi:hypothetical protein
LDDDLGLPSPVKKVNKRRKQDNSESDTDFQADTDEESEAEAEDEFVNAAELANPPQRTQNGVGATKVPSTMTHKFSGVTIPLHNPPDQAPPQPRGGIEVNVVQDRTIGTPNHPRPAPTGVPTASAQVASHAVKAPKPNGVTVKPFKRATIPIRSPLNPTYNSYNDRICPACHKPHPQGACELKVAGVEHCGLCGLAHYGHSRTCPHIKSETQVREMLAALKNSPEKKELVDLAMKYLRGVKGTLVQQKKRDREKAAAAMQGLSGTPSTTSMGPQMNPGHAPYTPNGVTGGALPVQYPNFPTPREVPNVYQGPSIPAPGSVGSYVQQRSTQQQRALQMQGNGDAQYDDLQVESALRGFLGQGA